MNTLIKYLCLYAALLLFTSACAPNRHLTYFNNLGEGANYTAAIKNMTEPVIQPNDILGITVSSLNPESNILFNNGVLQDNNSNSPAVSKATGSEGYLVDKDGEINFPVLGKIQLAGLTKNQATNKLTEEIKKSVKNPIVNIRFLNFKITVIGEVNRPSTFAVPSEKINVLEALGLAGDMTPYGKRENVLVIREKEGVRTAVRMDFTNKDLLNSPYFYLQQNDIVYVEPVKAKVLQGSNSTYYLPIVSAIISIASILVFALRN
jgi:polysaccharide export outer membrane protein